MSTSMMKDVFDLPDVAEERRRADLYYESREETGWRERLGIMWRMDEWGNLSPELTQVRDSTLLAVFGGFVYGSVTEGNKVARIFLDQNKYTMFRHPREAQRALQDRVLLGGFQGGGRVGLRLGTLVFCFCAVSQSLTVIRNYINPLDYSLAGGVMGALYRLNMGPRGMFGAGVGGAFLGLQAGVVTWGLQKMSGLTVAEKYEMEYRRRKEENKKLAEKKAEEDARTQTVLSQETVEKEELSVPRKLITNVRKWLGDHGLLDSSDIIEDGVEVEMRPEDEKIKSIPGLESLVAADTRPASSQ